MRTYVSKPSVIFLLTFILALLFATGACQPATNTNTNTNTAVNVNTAPANTNSNVAAVGTAINTREPEKYRATLVFTAQTEGGEKTIGIPSLSAEVARNGDDRRVSFKLPDGSDLIYIDHDNKHYVVAPGRKQYAELTPEATGMQIQKLITPGQLVQRLENLKGVERVGDEEVNGRKAEKYRYATTSNTNTQAGQVSTQAFVYVDKETGLPLRSELFAETSGDVKGVKGAHIVAEFRDISTTVDDSIFEIPAGMNKVSPEQVRQQINAVTSTLAAVVKAMMSNMSGTPSTSASPAATTSPTPRP
ncbi:MAG: hypothetical protein ABI596_00110 [Pyrinomonadaceae bacterium]